MPHNNVKQAGSMVDYLYPNAKEAPAMVPNVTRLQLPVRVGIAFVPGKGYGGLNETEKMQLLERVKASFSSYDFIGKIEVIPTTYLRAGGGFSNLDQVARLFNVDVVALMSYDQVQFSDSNALSVLYWTIVGAYIIHGDRYDVQTMLDAAVFDVHSRKLLFRAPGTSQVKGDAAAVNFNEKARNAQSAGYTQALDQLLPNLKSELDRFKQNIKNNASIQVENRPGYKGGGAIDGLLLSLAAMLAMLGWRRRAA